MALKRMDNVGIVVEDQKGVIDIFRELGLDLEGRGVIKGERADRVTGLGDRHVGFVMMRTPDGHERLVGGRKGSRLPTLPTSVAQAPT